MLVPGSTFLWLSPTCSSSDLGSAAHQLARCPLQRVGRGLAHPHRHQHAKPQRPAVCFPPTGTARSWGPSDVLTRDILVLQTTLQPPQPSFRPFFPQTSLTAVAQLGGSFSLCDAKHLGRDNQIIPTRLRQQGHEASHRELSPVPLWGLADHSGWRISSLGLKHHDARIFPLLRLSAVPFGELGSCGAAPLGKCHGEGAGGDAGAGSAPPCSRILRRSAPVRGSPSTRGMQGDPSTVSR